MERQIVIGLISNIDYINYIRPYWKSDYMGDDALRLIANWSVEYYDKHGEPISTAIETVFDKKRKRIDKDLASEIEEDLLPALSNEAAEEPKSLKYLLDETEKYFKGRSMLLKSETINDLIAKDDLVGAERIEESFELFKGFEKDDEIAFEDGDSLDKKIDEVFANGLEPVIKYLGPIGQLLNEHLIQGGFVGILAPEKRYKSWILADMAMTAVDQDVPVALFQAGDMTENQQMLRLLSYSSKRPTKENHHDFIYVPQMDCVLNQRNECAMSERECDTGITNKSVAELRGSDRLTKKELIEAIDAYPDYKPCINCAAFAKNQWGTIYLNKIRPAKVLSKKYAKIMAKKFFVSNEKTFRMRTFVNGTLSVAMIRNQIMRWHKLGFFPRLILIDYADLLVDHSHKEPRHQQNQIWKDLRALSQEFDVLVITPTQADANSYEVATLKLKNFSEDKRKYSHVTAMFGLNHDKDGIEKSLGVLRINKLIVREGVNEQEQVYVTQRLDIGRPIVHSFF